MFEVAAETPDDALEGTAYDTANARCTDRLDLPSSVGRQPAEACLGVGEATSAGKFHESLDRCRRLPHSLVSHSEVVSLVAYVPPTDVVPPFRSSPRATLIVDEYLYSRLEVVWRADRVDLESKDAVEGSEGVEADSHHISLGVGSRLACA